jgi:YidC/Oxa1 family membrane protein insertase
MDKKTIAAFILSLAIWLGWQKFYWEPHQKSVKEWQAYQASLKAPEKSATAFSNDKSIVTEASQAQEGATKTKTASARNNAPAKETTASLDGSQVVLSNSPDLFRGWKLDAYKTSEEDESKRSNIDLNYVAGNPTQFEIGFSDEALNQVIAGNFTAAAATSKDALYQDALSDSKLDIARSVFAAESKNTLRVELKFNFKAEVPKFVFIDLAGNPKRDHDKPGSILGEFPDKVELTYWNKEGRHTTIADQIHERIESTTGVHWLGLNTRYFLFAVLPENKKQVDEAGVQIQRAITNGRDMAFGRLAFPTNGEKNLTIPLKVYFGPKQLETLESVSRPLMHAVDFGWTSAIAIPLLKALQWVYSYTHNYGVAIIVVTLLVKILLFPLTYKSMKSMAQLSKLKPQMERIQKKYADDKEKLQKEIFALYKTHGANPISGCLPILLQMPVFFALYRVLFNCMELYQAPFIFWIQDLSAKDHWFVTPVLLIGLMYLQQRLSPTTTTDPTQQAVLRYMPVMFGVFMLFLPSGLNIYMLVNTVVSVLQQYYLNKKFGLNIPLIASEGDSGGAVAKPT